MKYVNKTTYRAFFFVALSVLSSYIYAHGDLGQRIHSLTHAIEKDSNNDSLYLKRSQLYFDKGLYLRAQSDLTIYFKHVNETRGAHDPTFLDAVYAQSKICLKLNDIKCTKKYIRIFMSGIKNDAARSRGYNVLAEMYLLEKEPKQAFDSYVMAVSKLDPPEPSVLIALAQTSMLLDDSFQYSALSILRLSVEKIGPVSSVLDVAIEIARHLSEWSQAQDFLLLMLEPAVGFRQAVLLAQQGDIWFQAKRVAEAQRSWTASLVAIDILPVKKKRLLPVVQLREKLQEKLKS